MIYSEKPGVIDWYESEVPTRVAMTTELQRIARRTRVRPWPVIVLALLVTAGVTYKVATKPRIYTADVVLAVSEGTMSNQRSKAIPFDQLKEYVSSVLLPDGAVLALIERFYPGRIDKVGRSFALESFRDKVNIAIWKNSFVYYHEYDANAQKSARIGIEVADEDPDDAFAVAQALASIIIQTHDEQRRKLAQGLAAQVALMRDTMQEKVDNLSAEITVKQAAMLEAKRAGNDGLAAALSVDVNALVGDLAKAEGELGQIASSPDAVADRITAANLDTTVSIVDEVRPERIEQSGMVLAMLIAVVGVGSLIGAALVLGAFDPRIHEIEDVTRLELPVLGHLPGFPGDDVGSLEARGAKRARVPSFLRWRSHR